MRVYKLLGPLDRQFHRAFFDPTSGYFVEIPTSPPDSRRDRGTPVCHLQDVVHGDYDVSESQPFEEWLGEL